MVLFSTKILRWRVGGRGKFNFLCRGAAGSGAELVTGAAGRHPGERGRRRGGLVRFNSKSYKVPLLVVHFEVMQTYFVPPFDCTAFRRLVTG